MPIFEGTDGNDVIEGTVEADVIDGGLGNDTLGGGDGNDSISGGAGDDVLVGGAGRDRLIGGAGNDIITYDSSDLREEVQGGEGFDILVLRPEDRPFAYPLLSQGFEAGRVTQTDSGGNDWSSITNLFNSGWQVTQQTVL